jgi:hypothetical protein
MNDGDGTHASNLAVSPVKIQNEDSLGKIKNVRDSEFIPKYHDEDLLDQIREFLQPSSTLKKSNIGTGVYKHFYRHSD